MVFVIMNILGQLQCARPSKPKIFFKPFFTMVSCQKFDNYPLAHVRFLTSPKEIVSFTHLTLNIIVVHLHLNNDFFLKPNE